MTSSSIYRYDTELRRQKTRVLYFCNSKDVNWFISECSQEAHVSMSVLEAHIPFLVESLQFPF